MTAGIAVAVVVAGNVLGPTGPVDAPRPSDPVASPSAAAATLDGFAFGYLPPGATSDGRDSTYTRAVDERGLGDGIPPTDGTAQVSVSLRRYEFPGGGVPMFVSVVRPQVDDGGGTSVAEVAGWLLAGARSGTRELDAFPVRTGTAYLHQHRGTEVTTTALMLVTTAGPVIMVQGGADLADEELRRIAENVHY